MAKRRLNIMLYSSSTGEQVVLPVNPENIEIKYGKSFDKFEIIGFGEINVMKYKTPVSIKLSHFLPENNDVFNTNSKILYSINGSSYYNENEYSISKVVSMFKRWAQNRTRTRLVIDDEINLECMVVSFTETLRENTASKPYILEVLEYRNPYYNNTQEASGLITKRADIEVPASILMAHNDTLYSIADKYGLDYKILSDVNGIKDVNSSLAGLKILTTGARAKE